ncbi:MAG: acid phosphatase/vanadium-dependent haloperoxidase related protein [Clostridia bacterium]|jgi:acid phosphatase family membrane protein YuiD|nr:acid phosphatase/vanadium-dependent haloperoxidase related protein [Clostridia bacterium]
MDYIKQISNNNILWAAIVSWFVAQSLKVLITLIYSHKLDLKKFFASGGMPSSHSSFVVTLTVSIGQLYGYDHVLFAIAAVFSFIVMYDAANVRLEAGKQAALINQIIEVLEDPNLNPEERLKEILGHTPLQVLAGGILGILVALAFFGA